MSRHSRRRLRKQIESGEYARLEDLAEGLGMDRSYVGGMLRLTSLVPDIVEAIVRAEEPEGISRRRLQKGLPVCWRQQQERWGGG